MPALRTEITEIVTGLGMLGAADVDTALAQRPPELVEVDDATWQRLVDARHDRGHDHDFLAAWNNGRAFLARTRRTPGSTADRGRVEGRAPRPRRCGRAVGPARRPRLPGQLQVPVERAAQRVAVGPVRPTPGGRARPTQRGRLVRHGRAAAAPGALPAGPPALRGRPGAARGRHGAEHDRSVATCAPASHATGTRPVPARTRSWRRSPPGSPPDDGSTGSARHATATRCSGDCCG